MLKSTDVRAWIASLGIADDQHVYIGKLDNKQQKSIGVYGRSGLGSPGIALGGLECTTYDTKRLSLLEEFGHYDDFRHIKTSNSV